jgi:hypothetical protein
MLKKIDGEPEKISKVNNMADRIAKIEKLHPQNSDDNSCYIILEGGEDEGVALPILEDEIELVYDACREYLRKHI